MSTPEYAILLDKKVSYCDVETWATWFEKTCRKETFHMRVVQRTEVNDVKISTVFLGLNHGWESKPLWFETMIFGGPRNEYQEQYETWDEAVAGHAKALELVFSDRNKNVSPMGEWT